MPEGTYLGHRDHLGYPLTRNKPYYFRVPETQRSFALRVSHPIRLFDPSGKEREETKNAAGRIAITEAQPGLWSFIPGAASYVQLQDVPPVVSFGEASRFFVPPGIKKATPEPEWTPPREEGLVEGRFGRGLRITGKSYQAQCDALKQLPFPEGTIEFFFRPDWASRWLPEREPAPLWTAPPFNFTYRHQPQRLGNDSFYTWLQFHPVWENSGFGWITRAEAYASFDAGQWNHLACAWRLDPPLYVIYRNGVNVGELPDPNRYQRGPLVIPKRQGDGALALGPWSGTYDEFRISKVMRYAQDFAPPSQPFAEDADTVLLFHFDKDMQGAGNARNTVLVKP